MVVSSIEAEYRRYKRLGEGATASRSSARAMWAPRR